MDEPAWAKSKIEALAACRSLHKTRTDLQKSPSFLLGHTIKMMSLICTGTKVIPSRPFGYDQVVSTVPRAVYGAPSRPRLPIATSRGAPWMPVATTTASRGYLRRLAVVVVVATAPIYPTGFISVDLAEFQFSLKFTAIEKFYAYPGTTLVSALYSSASEAPRSEFEDCMVSV